MGARARDIVEEYAGALVQHGALNDRIYLLRAPDPADRALPGKLLEKARGHGYSKIGRASCRERVYGLV